MYKALFFALILTAGIATFAQDAPRTRAGGGPRIVAKVSLPGQTVGVTKTALYTPTADGLFRISSYMTMVVPGVKGAWWLTAYWTDDAGAEQNLIYEVNSMTPPPTASCNAIYACGSSVFVVYGKAGTAISYDIGAHAGAGGTYDVFIVVEQLM